MISAAYIPYNTLPHIFGENHKGITLNFGGKYFYEIEENNNEILIINRKNNIHFIKGFYHKSIPLVSAIVGKNGVGKTSLLKILNTFERTLIILEQGGEEVIINKTSKEFISNEPQHLGINDISLEKLYYSPFLDYDLKDIHSPVALVSYFESDLQQYYLDNIHRYLIFLNHSIIEELKSAYKYFPFYEYLDFFIKKYDKSYFRKIYIESKIGNPNRGDSLIHELNKNISDLENRSDAYTMDKESFIEYNKSIVENLQSDSLTHKLDKLWNLEEYKSESSQYIINQDNFLKDLEITILSFLMMNTIFALIHESINGNYNYSNLLQAGTFEERLDEFIKWYIINQDEGLYESIKDRVEIKAVNYRDILEKIDQNKIIGELGIDIRKFRLSIKNKILTVGKSKELYDFIKDNFTILENNLIRIDVKGDLEKYNQFFQMYKELIQSFRNTGLVIDFSLFEFVPNKKLSTGEKAILDFYSSLYSYIQTYQNKPHHNKENYLLLLDEADLGYHPLWKKKFILAITKTLPILFSELLPQKRNNETKEYEFLKNTVANLQIIFTTHDPLSLSDIPSSNIIFLDKNENDKTIISSKQKKTFGANISDLLSDSFFIEDGLMGDFAKEKIEETIQWIDENKEPENRGTSFEEKLKYYKKVIELIDEQIIKLKLAEMISELVEDKEFQRKLINEEIKFLEQKKKEL
ncbi:AAA family ATPase [Apibacter sp. HY039]|uniref:AAA family ATPase n=1 Tax=Apibacter sp. HY039 TaxID=2501476 RepID=UPI000FEB8DEF|nr:AAA family ATPase [Apibacter sp. HY039]